MTYFPQQKWLLTSLYLIMVILVQVNSFSFRDQSEEDSKEKWPTRLTFGETKTHDMLGTSLLRRWHARMDHTENLIKTEINQMYEKLSNQMQKNFRMCDRQRRKADSTKMTNGDNFNEKSTRKENQQKRDRKVKAKQNKGKDDRRRSNERNTTVSY